MNSKIRFDLQFFGGGTKTTRIPTRDAEPEELTNLRNTIYRQIMPGLESYNTNSWQKAGEIADNAINQQNTLLGQLTGDNGQIAQSGALANEIAEIARTGNIPSTLTNAMNASVNSGLQSSMGNMLNNLAGRGVLNSSVTTAGTNQLSQAAADAFNRNYLTAYQSVLSGMGNALQGSQNNTAATLSAINALGNIPGQAYESAGAALTPAFNLWRTWQNSYDNRTDYDTVVQQGK